MEIIPVLDLMKGRVVRGIAGRRESYVPIQSKLVESSEPSEVAAALRQELEFNRFYVADLDAIVDDAPQWEVLGALAADGFELLVDAGLREPTRAERLLAVGARQVVAALETLPGPVVLESLLSQFGSDRVVFSLDLKSGQPLGNLSAWNSDDALAIAEHAIRLGVSNLIVLDLSAVGVAGGVSTLELCRQLRSEIPRLSLISGGGVRDLNDLNSLRESGIDGALVASALHTGKVGQAEIAALAQRPIDAASLAQPH